MDYILHGILKSRTWLSDFHFHFSLSQSYGFSSGHVLMWELDHKEGWIQKNSCFWTVVLEKTLESPLASKEIKPVNPKGNQHWRFIERTDAEAEAPVLWPLDAKSQLIGEDPDAGKGWRQEEKGITEDEMVGWHHRLNWYVWTSCGSWWWTGHAVVHGVTKSQTGLSEWIELSELNWVNEWNGGWIQPKWYSQLILPCGHI